jgi:hypothetical protein
LLDELRKRIDHSVFVVALVCPEEPAVNERVDLDTVKFDRKTAKASAPSCPATPHSACGGFPSGFGFDGRTVRRLPNHANVLDDDYCSVIVPDWVDCRTFSGNGDEVGATRHTAGLFRQWRRFLLFGNARHHRS